MQHETRHPLAGQTVKVNLGPDGVHDYHVEDYWDRVSGGSWMDAYGNPAALNYAMRGAVSNLPIDDEVLYGKIGAFGHLVHVSELQTGE